MFPLSLFPPLFLYHDLARKEGVLIEIIGVWGGRLSGIVSSQTVSKLFARMTAALSALWMWMHAYSWMLPSCVLSDIC
jgi:hypothetical protein